MNLLNEVETKKLDELKKTFIEQSEPLKEVNNIEVEDFLKLKTQMRCAELSLNDFSSGNFIVTCIGMLKAGKSTLVNLLARNENASPTGFGFDTTLRPALITYSDDEVGSIDVWIRNNPEKPLTKDILREIFQHLRDTDKTKKIGCAYRHEYDLNENNLKNVLCRSVGEAENNMLPSEPAMVVVKVPRNEDSLLSEEISILDTPGLDSGTSEWTKQGWYEWIIENSDLILFLQSSFAPLNKEAETVLKGINARNNTIPVWLLQNEMIGKPWLGEERIEQINMEQRNQAAKMFDKFKKCFQRMNANLGKADTVIFDENFPQDKKDELMKTSAFEPMEQGIRQDLKNNIGPIRRKNCIGKVKKDISMLKETLDEHYTSTNEKKAELEKHIRKLEKLKEDMAGMLSNPPNGVQYKCVDDRDEISFEDYFKKKAFYKLLNGKINHAFEKDKYYSAEEIKEIIEDAKNVLCNSVKDAINRLNNNSFTLKCSKYNGEPKGCSFAIRDSFEKFIERVNNNMSPTDLFSLEKIKEWSQIEIDLPSFSSQDINVDEIFNLTIAVGKKRYGVGCVAIPFFEKDRTSNEALPFFYNFYNPKDSSSGEFVKCIEKCEEELELEIRKWLNKEAFAAMHTDFIKKFNERIDSFIKEDRDKLECYQSDAEAIEQAQNACDKVISTMEKF